VRGAAFAERSGKPRRPPYRKKALTGRPWRAPVRFPDHSCRSLRCRRKPASAVTRPVTCPPRGAAHPSRGNRNSRAAPRVPAPAVTDAPSAPGNTIPVPVGIRGAVVRMAVRQEALAVKGPADPVARIGTVDRHRMVMLRLEAGEGNVPVGEAGISRIREITELPVPYGVPGWQPGRSAARPPAPIRRNRAP